MPLAVAPTGVDVTGISSDAANYLRLASFTLEAGLPVTPAAGDPFWTFFFHLPAIAPLPATATAATVQSLQSVPGPSLPAVVTQYLDILHAAQQSRNGAATLHAAAAAVGPVLVAYNTALNAVDDATGAAVATALQNALSASNAYIAAVTSLVATH